MTDTFFENLKYEEYQVTAEEYERYLMEFPLDLSLLEKKNDILKITIRFSFYHSDCSFSNFSPHKVLVDYL